jgi:hypothetical protein
VRWHYRDPLLLWLLPAAYGVHILEEWFGGFPEWVAVVVGTPLPRGDFVVMNVIGLSLMIAAVRAATRREENGWMAVAVAAILLVNGLLHILGTIVTRSYSPGLFSTIILYAPLTQLTLMRAWSQTTSGVVRRGVIAAIVLHAAVIMIAYTLATR